LPETLALMERDNVDVLLLGREANARTVCDVTRLWLAGTRAFAPGCVVVRATGAVHLLANSDDGVPPGFPTERLYGITWNPEKLMAALVAIPGVSGARRVGVDGMSPLLATMLNATLPGVQFVDGGALLTELQRRPDPDAAAAVTEAAAVADAGLAAMVLALAPGAHARSLRGACARAFAEAGVTTPAFEAVATPLDLGSSTWLASETAFADGERVVLRAGALRAGWEGSVARTYIVGNPPRSADPPAGWSDLIGGCRAGATVGTLRKHDAVVYGAGRGVEPWDDDVELAPGHMIAVELADADSIRQDIVHVTDADPVVVTRSA
jgi:Xaa-Pro aminopeptidase